MVIHYPKAGGTDDDEWFDNAIAETYITVIKDDKLITQAADLAEWGTTYLELAILNVDILYLLYFLK